MFQDEIGNPYYYNFLTGQSVWAPPSHPRPTIGDHSDRGCSDETDLWNPKAALAMIRNQNEYTHHDEQMTEYSERQRLKEYRRDRRMQRRRRREQRRKYRQMLFSHKHTSEHINSTNSSKRSYRTSHQSDSSFDDTTTDSLDMSTLSDEYDEEYFDHEALIDFKTLTTALSLWKDHLKTNYYFWLLRVPETIEMMSSLLASAKLAVKELSDWSVRHLLPRPCGENIDGID